MPGPHPTLQIGLRVDGKRCVVVGDGPGADERAARLADAGAIVSRQDPDHPDAFLIVCHDPEQAEPLARTARTRRIFYYAHDRPDLSDFSLPALARRGPLQLAVSTDGASPGLAGRLRAELGRLLDDAGGDLDALVGESAAARPTSASLAGRIRIEGRIVVSPLPGPTEVPGL